MKPDELIGKKIIGFRFETHRYNNLFYNYEMDLFVGKEGVIQKYERGADTFNVQFNENPKATACNWCYPAVLIEQYLVGNKPESFDEPGVEMPVENPVYLQLKQIYDNNKN